MANITWSYLDNPFNNRTKSNYKRMYEMATDHFDKIRAAGTSDPELQAIYDFGKEAYVKFKDLYTEAKYIRSGYRFETVTLENLVSELASTLARRWDVMIQVEYDIMTPEYQSLLPNKRKPFQQGSYEMRINEVKALARHLRDFPALATLQEEVDKFANQLEEVRSKQQGKEGNEQRLIDELESAREDLARVMQGMCSRLSAYYYDALYKVENFYELKYLRRTTGRSNEEGNESEQLISLGEEATVRLFEEGQIQGGDTVRITNTGGTTVEVLFEGVEETPITVSPGKFVSESIPEEGSVAALVIKNLSATSSGEVSVELL